MKNQLGTLLVSAIGLFLFAAPAFAHHETAGDAYHDQGDRY
jgi:hypothetical protein